MLVIQNETTEFVKEKLSSFYKKMSWNLHQYFGLNSDTAFRPILRA